MEYLNFSPLGQWTLCKATAPDSADEEPPKDEGSPTGRKYKVYHQKLGELHEDRGTKGSLHDFGGGTRPKQKPNWRHVGKIPRKLPSVYDDRHPGVGIGDD